MCMFGVLGLSCEAPAAPTEDGDAVIKMIIEGRSPTVRHVSRTDRVALDRIFDRINFDSKIQVRCVETKDQLAEILTQDSLTCENGININCPTS